MCVVVCDVNWFAVRSEFANSLVSAVNRSFVILGHKDNQDPASLKTSALAERFWLHVALNWLLWLCSNVIIEYFICKYKTGLS